MRETGVLDQELGLVLWLAIVANAAIWSGLQGALVDAIRRERLGKNPGDFVTLLAMLGRPKSSVSILMRSGTSRFDALLTPSGDPEIEERRRASLIASGVLLAAPVLGLVGTLYAIKILRAFLPGTVALWTIGAIAVAIAVWIAFFIRTRRSPSPSLPRLFAAMAGVFVNSACLVAAVFLWWSGGVAF